jgi:hypothetical protein
MSKSAPVVPPSAVSASGYGNVEAVEKPLSSFGTVSYLKETDLSYVNSS